MLYTSTPVLLLLQFLLHSKDVTAFGIGASLSTDWNSYVNQFQKNYSYAPVAYAQYYYNWNRRLIDLHNNVATTSNSLYTYTLRPNQFSDMRVHQFDALFPVAIRPNVSHDVTAMSVEAPPASYNPLTQLGLTSQVQNQGIICSSGWAYSTAKAIELMQALQTGNLAASPLSAQNLIDCAGQGIGCTTQNSQAAFDYLTQYNQDLHLAADYPDMPQLRTQGMCAPRGSVVTQLASYARINDGDDKTMMRYVAAGYPVVIEFNPTSFEFMNYGSGVFQQPLKLKKGSHFMTVIGYGHDSNYNLDYWLVENSFGTTWGENGYIRILRSAGKPLAKNAIFPYELR